MPKIQLFEDQLGTAQPQLNRGGASAGGSTVGTQSIGQLASIGADIASKVVANERALKVSSVTTQAAMELENYVFDLEKSDRDYGTQFERYQDFTKDLTERYSKQLAGDTAGLATFNSNIGQMAFKKGFNVRSNAITGQLDQQKGVLTLNMASLSELAVQGDEEQRELVKTKAQMLLQESYESGVVDAQEAANMGIKFQDDLVSAEARYDILVDPDQAIKKLLAGEYEGMSNERQMIWLEKANSASETRLRKQIADQDRTRREADRLEKVAAEKASKAGDQLLYSGELTTDWVEQNRDILDPSDYRFYYKAITTGSEASTNVELYSDLRYRASNGEDVRQEARSAVQRFQLKVADYNTLVNRSEQNVGIADAPNWFKQGEQYFNRSFRTSDINPDPGQAQRLANVLDDWTNWAIENPNATRADAMKVRDQLHQDYQLLNFDDILISTRKPQYIVGGYNSPDLDATDTKTLEAFESGEITEAEFLEQSSIIQRWRDTIQRAQEQRLNQLQSGQ